MRRILLVLVLLVEVCASSLDAQFSFRRRRPAAPAGPPVVAFTVPTDQSTHLTNATTIEIQGTALDSAAGTISVVTWENTTTAASGNCTITSVVGSLAHWTCGPGGGGGDTVVYQAPFTAANVNLSAYTPSIGSTCTEVVDTLGTLQITVRSEGDARPSASSTNNTLLYTCTPSPAITGTGWKAEFASPTLPGANESLVGFWRWTDTDNKCWLKRYTSTANPDLVWGRTEAGVHTTLGTANANAVASAVISIERAVSNFTIAVGGVAVTAATGSNPVSSTFCDDNNVMGIGFGSVNGVATDQISTAARFDYYTITDTDAATPINLNVGENTIIISATDNDANVTTKTMVVTRGTDTQSPIALIDTPTAQPSYATSTAAITISGTCTDNVACTSVTWECTNQTCTADSGTATMPTATTYTFSTSVVCSAAPGTTNTVLVTPHDAAMNAGVTDTLSVVCTSADITSPTVTITSDGGSGAGADFSTASASVVLSGTSSDNVAVTAISANCGPCSPSVVQAIAALPSASPTWTVTVTLAFGANLVTISALDEAGNPAGTDTITVTRTGTSLNAETTALATGTVGLAYNSCLNASGGTSPYTWTKVSGTFPTGLSLSGNCIVGTPGVGTEGTYTNHVYRVTDAVMTPDDTVAMSIVIGAAGTGRNEHFDTMVARSDMKVALSGRPVVGTACTDTYNGKSFASGAIGMGTCNPFFATQLSGSNQVTGYRSGSSAGVVEAPFMDYLYATDTDPEKADGMKVVIPAYGSVGPLSAAITVTTPTSITFTETLGTVQTVNNGSFRIDDEIVTCDATVGDANPTVAGSQCSYENPAGTWTMYVRRGEFGTTAATHTNGTTVKRTVNGVCCGAVLLFPISGTSEGHTYLIGWDLLATSSYLGIVGNPGNKTYQITTTSTNDVRRYEPKMNYSGNTAGSTTTSPNVKCTGDSGEAYNNSTKHAFAWATRVYNLAYNNASSWLTSDKLRVGPNAAIFSEHLTPQTSQAVCVVANRWTRVWYRIQINATDYDILDAWFADTVREPVQMFTGLQTSIYPGPDNVKRLANWKVQFNDTYPFHALGSLPTFNPFRDRVLYISNFYVLEDPPADLVAAGILVKPQ